MPNEMTPEELQTYNNLLKRIENAKFSLDTKVEIEILQKFIAVIIGKYEGLKK